MILSFLIHKNKSAQIATLTVATPATLKALESPTVAKVATVTVADPEFQKAVIAVTPDNPALASNPELMVEDGFFSDDRRFCSGCGNLSGGRCLAAWRDETVASRQYRPIDNLPRRCEGYAPKFNDPDQRTGKQRWPKLNPLRK
ncbi:MAG: hypothetical protein ACXW1Z_25175 [Methylobacter sp.]